jgi:digeranylgeranylglycerophospholipid reductase
MKADILVVGAGPAGSTAAEVAARMGATVALVDKKWEIGTPVQCGGFLPEARELKSLLPRARLPETIAEPHESCIIHKTGIQRIYAPSGKSKEFQVNGQVLDRRAFDRHLARRAARAGAMILPATRATLVSGEVRLSGQFPGNLNPKVIIGADGPVSGIARSAMAREKQELGICLEYEMADVQIDPNAAEMYFGSRCAPGGYAWIIPLGDDAANVGIGVRASYLDRGATLGQMLDRFIREHPQAGEKLKMGEVISVMRGSVPSGGVMGKIQMGKVLLAGDAAGQVMASSGGGIPLAAVAGRIAGEVAAGSLEGRAKLEDYEARAKIEMGRELERSVQIRRMVDLAMKSDRMMDALFSALEPDQMKAIMRGQISTALKAVLGRQSSA